MAWDFNIINNAKKSITSQSVPHPRDVMDFFNNIIAVSITSGGVEVIDTATIFKNGSTFQANDDQPTSWEGKGTNVMRPKPNGSGNFSFIEENSSMI